MGSAISISSRATSDSSWSSDRHQTKVEMRTNLTVEQFSEWEDLKRRYVKLRWVWRHNTKRNKQRPDTVKRGDVLVSLARRFQGFGEVLNENRAETRRQNEAQKEVQDAAARDQKQERDSEAERETKRQERETKRQKVQLQVQARQAKRPKVHDENVESGVGFSVEQL